MKRILIVFLFVLLVGCSKTTTFVVQFETNGGTAIDAIDVEDGATLAFPADPVKDGYAFGGWYLDEGLSEQVPENHTITTNLTLYAKWTNGPFTVTFFTNGGNAIAPISFDVNRIMTLPAPVRAGYVFKGWAEGATATTAITFTRMPARNLNLYALWEEVVVDVGEVVIGLLVPLSGEHAEQGLQAYNGVEMAIAEINANGGILGKSFRVVALNTQGDVANIPALYEQLTQEPDLIAVIGGILPDAAAAIAALAEGDGIAFIALDATQPELTEDTTVVYRLTVTDEMRGELAAKYVLDGIATEHPAILYNEDNQTASDLAYAYRQVFLERLTFVELYSVGSDPQWYDVIISSMQFRGVDVIFSPGVQSYMTELMAQATASGFSVPYVVIDAWNYGETPIDRARILEEYHPSDSDPFVSAFTSNYNDTYEENPTTYSALAYDAVRILAQTLDNAASGVFAPSLLRNAELDHSVSGFLGFNDNGDARKRLVVVEYADGNGTVIDSVTQDEQ